MNSAATIRIFVKGLKKACILATQVYEKGPQTLADAISKLEKLQAAQQLTATLLPLSTVNVMSHEEVRCYQCEELGHIAHHCPNVHCFECDKYGHIVVDCHTGYHSQALLPIIIDRILTTGTAPDQPLDTITGTHTGRSRSQSQPHRHRSHSLA